MSSAHIQFPTDMSTLYKLLFYHPKVFQCFLDRLFLIRRALGLFCILRFRFITIFTLDDAIFPLDPSDMDFKPVSCNTCSLICPYVVSFWNPDISISYRQNFTPTFLELISPLESKTTVSQCPVLGKRSNGW